MQITEGTLAVIERAFRKRRRKKKARARKRALAS
jgi:hypothetical protein